MSQPHHFVFNELQRVIQKCVPFEPLIPFLLEKKIIKETDLPKFRTKNGMKLLTSFLRNKDFDVFVNFVHCIAAAGERDPSVNLSIVSSIQSAIEGFDRSHGTSHSAQMGLKHQQKQETATAQQISLPLPPPASETARQMVGAAVPEIPSLDLQSTTPAEVGESSTYTGVILTWIIAVAASALNFCCQQV